MATDDIHLCQPDCRKSCGACCGIYNYANSSRESLTTRLSKRTALFRGMVENKRDLAQYSESIRSSEDPTKRYEVIYCCEFIGFLDENEKKVGCLLHPAQNAGEDWRDVSFYGSELCAGHFCPSYHYLSTSEKLCLLTCCEDWYLYGLCVTDIDLVKEYFKHISERIFEAPLPSLLELSPLKETAAAFFSWKEHWQFRCESTRRLGKYYFDGSQYMISKIDYAGLGVTKSRFDKILTSLTSQFANTIELEKAEALIEDNLQRFAAAYWQIRKGQK